MKIRHRFRKEMCQTSRFEMDQYVIIKELFATARAQIFLNNGYIVINTKIYIHLKQAAQYVTDFTCC